MLGDQRVAGEWLPDNDMIEAEVRAYQALFHGDTQPRILALLRRVAVLAMADLAPFRPYLVGAVLNGTATGHSDIYLQCFCDSPKDATLHLLNAGVDFETSETRHFGGRGEVETLSFLWKGQWPDRREARLLSGEVRAELGTPVGIHIALYDATTNAAPYAPMQAAVPPEPTCRPYTRCWRPVTLTGRTETAPVLSEEHQLAASAPNRFPLIETP